MIRAVYAGGAWTHGSPTAVAGGEDRHARRAALWQLGIITPGVHTKTGQQLALELPLPGTPRLPALGEWEALLADYAATGTSIDRHPLELLPAALTARGARATAELASTDHGAHVTIGGLVIARQRSGTANGITFLLLEDEHGTLNVIVPARLYEANRATVRTQPLSITALPQPSDAITASVRDLRKPSESPAAQAEDFALVAPPAMNFEQGRRR